MECHEAKNRIGMYLDDELSPESAEQLRAHLARCSDCTHALTEHQAWAAALRRADPATNASAPPELWKVIVSRLDCGTCPARRKSSGMIAFWRKPLAIAASLALLVGVAAFTAVFLSGGAEIAQASTVDYTILLNGLTGQVDAAIDQFLNYYHAEPIPAERARAAAPALSYRVPPDLPGGFALQQAYRLRFGELPGVAAIYRRDAEPLVVFFHPSAHSDHSGRYQEMPCIVGTHEGVQIQVGRWRLMHFMDKTTCHCVLTRMAPGDPLGELVKSVVPSFATSSVHQH